MRNNRSWDFIECGGVIAFLILFTISVGLSQSPDTIDLWQKNVPEETAQKHPPVVTPDHKGDVTRLTDVTDPLLLVYKPEESKRRDVGVIVCPGGGYKILAIDKEGTEIAAWLNSFGITAFVLEYRVPDDWDGANQDMQRAVRIVRSKFINQNHELSTLGVIGFSAGAHLCARVSTHYNDQAYTPEDNADTLSCRPDFTLLIYPAELINKDSLTLRPEVSITQNLPPIFIMGTADDSHGKNPLVFALALREAKIHFEMHYLPTGGHGYGLRKGNIAAEYWPPVAMQWIEKTLESLKK